LLFAAAAGAALIIAGCGTNAGPGSGHGGYGSLAAAPMASASPNPHWVFIADTTVDAVTSFNWFLDGNIVPSQMIQGPTTKLVSPQTVGTPRNGTVFVGDIGPGGPNIKVYAFGATGDVAPTRTITSPSMTDTPLGLAFDSVQNLWVAAQTDGILEFAKGAKGSSTPIAIIAGPDTGLSDVIAVALDPNNNVFALDGASHAILEFPAGSNGDAAPIRKLTGTKTQLLNAIDFRVSRHDYLYVSDGHQMLGFGANKNGNVVPSQIATITGYSRIMGIQLHDSNLEFSALADSDGSPALVCMLSSMTGPSTPVRVISGSDTGLAGLGRIKIFDLAR
jgi:hypothetical protein